MTLARTTATNALGYALNYQGRSRKSPVVPWTNNTWMDDCAAFCSYILWGAKDGMGPITWVDNFKTAKDGTYHAGKAGLQPGDVVLFDWEFNGIGNHVEFCLTAPTASGQFVTIGANGSDTVAVKQRVRNAFVLGYFRPNYGTPAAPKPSKPATSKPAKDDKETDMLIIGTKNGQYLLTDAGLTHIPDTADVRSLLSAGVKAAEVSDKFYESLARLGKK